MQKIVNIELLRFPLTILIVMEHTLPQHISDGGHSAFNQCFDIFLRGNSVPVFFFISGFLFFYGTGEFNTSVWIRKLSSRIKTLLLPYIIWNIFAVLLLWMVFATGMQTYMADATVFTPSLSNILNCFWMYDGRLAGGYTPSDYPINVALWYVRDLMILCLFVPVIYNVVKRSYVAAIIIAVCFQAITKDPCLLFFMLGTCMAMGNRKFSMFTNKSHLLYSALVYLTASLVLLFVDDLNETAWEYIIKQIGIIAFAFMAFGIAGSIKSGNPLLSLAATSSFVYFSHQPICGKINKLIMKILMPQTQTAVFAVNMLAVVITVWVLLVAHSLLRKYQMKTLKVLTGERGGYRKISNN